MLDAPLGATVVDNPLDRPGISAVAYTDDDRSATTATRLFGIDTIRDQLVRHDAPEAGTTADLGPVGSFGDAVGGAGLDVHSTLDRAGATIDDDAFAVVGLSGVPTLLAVDLADGSVRERGTFDVAVTDLAIRLDQDAS